MRGRFYMTRTFKRVFSVHRGGAFWMSKLNNLSRQHLPERPVMGDEDRWKEDECGEWVSGNQWERMNERSHAHTRAQTGLWLCKCLCVPIHWLTALTASETLPFGASPAESFLTCMLICSHCEQKNWASGRTLFSLFPNDDVYLKFYFKIIHYSKKDGCKNKLSLNIRDVFSV